MFKLTDGQLQIQVGNCPGIVSLERTDGMGALPGNPAVLDAVWTVFDPETCETREINGFHVRYEAVPIGERSFSWYANIMDGALKAEIQTIFEDKRLTIRLINVVETPRCHLVTLRLNGLAAAVSTDSKARMALPSHGGRLIDPANCGDGQIDHRYNWILDSFGSVAIIYTEKLTAVIRIHRMDDQLTSLVGGKNNQRYAQSGALLRRRYTCLDVSYRKAKDGSESPIPEGEEEYISEKDFLLAGDPFVTLELIPHEPITPETGWVIGAKKVRDSLPGKRTDYYRDKMVYKIFIGAPGQEVQTNLEQIQHVIEEVAARTGNAGQIPYLVGFQHEGHDSKYPDVFMLNPALESKEKLGELVEHAEKLNCRISFHDNYDDAYRNSPSWDPEDISRDHTGHLLRGGIWNGVQAYWNSMPWYAEHKAEQRICRTLEQYPFLKDTYHLDVLTASVFRVDFRTGKPTGKEADLNGRKAIVEKFRAHGLDVTSEACGLPFVGSISYFWHMQRVPRELYLNDQRIPMVPFLVHGKADYAGTHSATMRDIMDGLLYGGFYCNDVTSHTPIRELTNAYFMLQAPLNLLRNDTAECYEEAFGWKKIRYASGSEIAVRFESEECRVTINGKRYIENGSAMIPQEDGSTVLYRCQEEPYTDVRWATEFSPGTKLKGIPLGAKVPEREWIVESDGCINIDTEIGIAYRVKPEEQ